MYGLCVVFGKNPHPDDVHKLIKKPAEIIIRMRDFDPSNLNYQQHQSLDKYIYSKEFDLQVISRYCTGAVLIAEWLIAVHSASAKILTEEVNNTPELMTEYSMKLKKCKSFHALISK